jgi:hypothetical protein
MMGRGLYTKLADAMTADADAVGNRRQDNAERGGYIPGNGLVATLAECRRLHILGARCERAGQIAFPTLVWNKGLEGPFRNLPDLGDFIDVKGIERPYQNDHALIVPANRVTLDWAYLLVAAEEHPYYWIAGWMWGRELAVPDNKRFPNRPAYFVEQDRLHPPFTLQQIARERT